MQKTLSNETVAQWNCVLEFVIYIFVVEITLKPTKAQCSKCCRKKKLTHHICYSRLWKLIRKSIILWIFLYRNRPIFIQPFIWICNHSCSHLQTTVILFFYSLGTMLFYYYLELWSWVSGAVWEYSLFHNVEQ